MTGGIGAVKNIRSDLRFPDYIPWERQLRKLRQIIRFELSPCQRAVVEAYYFEGKTMEQIAAEQGVNRSTVSRTLHRGLRNLQRYLQY